MKKRTVLMGGTGLAALLAGGTRLFFEVAIHRNYRIPHLKKKENEEGLRQEI